MSGTEFVKSLTEDKCDPELGVKVFSHLRQLGLETVNPINYAPRDAFSNLEKGIEEAYANLGLDVYSDPSIKDTPKRFAKMFVGELTKGLNYDFFPKCTATPNGSVLAEEAPSTRNAVGPDDSKVKKVIGAVDEVVLVKNIRVTSLCEHHLQTIDGVCHIAYKPNEKVLGLSKFARVAEFFAARPQIQERMTEQIFHALGYVLETNDIAVIIDATHFCMRARGVKQPGSTTQTNKVGGIFLSKPEARKEFFDACA